MASRYGYGNVYGSLKRGFSQQPMREPKTEEKLGLNLKFALSGGRTFTLQNVLKYNLHVAMVFAHAQDTRSQQGWHAHVALEKDYGYCKTIS